MHNFHYPSGILSREYIMKRANRAIVRLSRIDFASIYRIDLVKFTDLL